MSKPIIEVSGLSKQYRIGTKLPYKTFRGTLMNVVTSPAKLLKRNRLKRPLLGTDRGMRRFQCSDNRLEKKIMWNVETLFTVYLLEKTLMAVACLKSQMTK